MSLKAANLPNRSVQPYQTATVPVQLGAFELTNKCFLGERHSLNILSSLMASMREMQMREKTEFAVILLTIPLNYDTYMYMSILFKSVAQ